MKLGSVLFKGLRPKEAFLKLSGVEVKELSYMLRFPR